VLHVIDDPATQAWLRGLNPAVEALRTPGGAGETPRPEEYAAMAAAVRAALERGERVCLVAPGHPGAFSDPTHSALAVAREMGLPARILPGVGAEGRLFADLGVDPAETGWQCWDSTDFLVHGRRPDPTAALVLFQPAMVGARSYCVSDAPGLHLLTERLAEIHGAAHEVIVYEASFSAGAAPRIDRVRLSDLAPRHLGPASLLYVPPSAAPRPDLVMMARLARLDADDVARRAAPPADGAP
jgi:hypothetical protein